MDLHCYHSDFFRGGGAAGHKDGEGGGDLKRYAFSEFLLYICLSPSSFHFPFTVLFLYRPFSLLVRGV